MSGDKRDGDERTDTRATVGSSMGHGGVPDNRKRGKGRRKLGVHALDEGTQKWFGTIHRDKGDECDNSKCDHK